MSRTISSSGKEAVLFKEEQRFTQWYIWAFLFGLLSIPIYGIVQQVFLDEPFGNKPMSDLGLGIFLLGVLLFVYFFWWIRLRTTVTRQYIRIQYTPLADKKIPWEDVESARIVEYSPWIGFGLRLGTPYGTVYNVKGRKGLSVRMKSGKKYMIGTQRFRELEEIAQKVAKSL